MLIEKRSILEVKDFDGFMVFEEASINTCILLLASQRVGNHSFRYERLRIPTLSREEISSELKAPSEKLWENLEVSWNTLSADYWNFVGSHEIALWQKVNSAKFRQLGNLCRIFVGLQTSKDKVFVLQHEATNEKYFVVRSRADNQVYELEKHVCRTYLAKLGVTKYYVPNAGLVLIYPYEIDSSLFNESDLARRFPNTYAYLKKHEVSLRAREKGKFDDQYWYRYGRNQSINQFDEPKLIVQVISSFNRFCYDVAKTYFSGGGNGPYYGLRPTVQNLHMHYFSGTLNSTLQNWIHHKQALRTFKTGYSYGKRYIERLPIRTIDFDNPADVTMHDQMVELVNTMLNLHKQLPDLSGIKRNTVEARIERTDRDIDALVYELYGLTDDEIAIVEGG